MHFLSVTIRAWVEQTGNEGHMDVGMQIIIVISVCAWTLAIVACLCNRWKLQRDMMASKKLDDVIFEQEEN
jgi:hypothetical protein